MSKIHIVYGDAHAHPNYNNERATLISNLIGDVNPDVVVNLGDNADIPSLASFDKGLKHFYGRNYRQDIDAHLEFDDRVWSPLRKRKRKLPKRIFIIGNHEYRIEKATDKSPELSGTISLKDLELEKNYNIIVPYRGYGTPGIHEEDGILYSHYVVAGISNKPLGSLHQGYQLLQKYHRSVTVGHMHIFNFNTQTVGKNNTINGLCIPCFVDYEVEWAGEMQEIWNRGVIIKHGVDNGKYDLEFVSLERLKKEYGK